MSDVGLLLDAGALGARREIATGALAPLAASLAADLHDVAHRDLFVPPEKARLTRIGGRCAIDGALLSFDPYTPHEHTCPRCGRAYRGEAHYRWWIMWYQLWLAERAVHGAVLGAVTGDDVARRFAVDVLGTLTDRYLGYPNRDNVLGPTRLFFSTYLESIWLLQLCVALDLLESDPRGNATLGTGGERMRERLIAPSRALVALYDEHRSNRQIWNAAALAASARALGDATGFEHALLGQSGIVARLGDGLLADGTWYEGENYHQFAHRGLWYGVAFAERAGIALPPDLVERFSAGFIAPFLTAFPDLTLPARRDSQWATSLRQWRWAEWCELGLAQGNDDRLAGTLATFYASDLPRRDTGRWRSTAESERNEPASQLTRADLGWKSLLFARPEIPASRWTPRSVLLESQGIAIFRRDAGRRWVALDYGASGGSHGHPDRLDLLLVDGDRRWLDDMGTGSYVERTLHWYRSTLAHNAPLVDGESQRRVDGALEAYDERGDWGWVRARASIARDVTATRSVVVGPRYVIDRLEWVADRSVTLDLPLHVDALVEDALVWRSAAIAGAGHLEDGFDFLTDVRTAPVAARHTVQLHANAGCRAWLTCSADATLVHAIAPGAPGQGMRPFFFVRVVGATGAIETVWDTSDSVSGSAIADDCIVVTAHDGATETHCLTDRQWRVTQHVPATATPVTLAGTRAAMDSALVRTPEATRPRLALPRAGAVFELAEPHYRRTEESWIEAGRPRAAVSLRRDGAVIVVDVHVAPSLRTFVAPGAENPLDNDRAEIHGDGVQLYVASSESSVDRPPFGWLLVPVATGRDVHVVPLSPASRSIAVDAAWSPTRDGYTLRARVPIEVVGGPAMSTFAFDLVVNETTPDRERRRGQLVLSGAAGEFAYLQGDRHDSARLVVIDLAHLRSAL